ncbi:DUF721 domain-containing protein [Halopseudomonas salegens]|uniref:DUF721 domain-containing protein n=1 Tax=Halopseudomonas salegens TaxID=1434072 RepID=A0A1H2GR31_9GAMM|nr:DciA family protein [Halopseudomonas salegens]SDU22077.1 Protein of unknown function [Halopseudomonas salegens]
MSLYPLSARQPGDLLRTSSTLRGLFQQARQLERLQLLLDSQLEPAAREHCRIASLRDGVMRLIVSNGHWATRLRYQQRRLIRQLQAFNEFATLTKIHCKVQPVKPPRTVPPRVMRPSKVAAESLQTTAEGIEDPTLRSALERLARHHRQNAGTAEE